MHSFLIFITTKSSICTPQPCKEYSGSSARQIQLCTLQFGPTQPQPPSPTFHEVKYSYHDIHIFIKNNKYTTQPCNAYSENSTQWIQLCCNWSHINIIPSPTLPEVLYFYGPIRRFLACMITHMIQEHQSEDMILFDEQIVQMEPFMIFH